MILDVLSTKLMPELEDVYAVFRPRMDDTSYRREDILCVFLCILPPQFTIIPSFKYFTLGCSYLSLFWLLMDWSQTVVYACWWTDRCLSSLPADGLMSTEIVCCLPSSLDNTPFAVAAYWLHGSRSGPDSLSQWTLCQLIQLGWPDDSSMDEYFDCRAYI